ncbi:glycosyltransferase family 2 protein [Paenirhodobacter sp.]|uniref:glycosyltransferase family 2 protein n=1 Tax=Paenirhodobacter sp. TaxID=1965326 RepID=UPI003B50850B
MTRFTIIVPCYNAARTLRATLDALTGQTFTDWEALFIDDGSRDATSRILALAARCDPRIRLLRNPGRGPSAARNHAARAEACGEILAFCDADDIWAADKLAQLDHAFTADPEVDGLYGRVAFFAEDPARPSTVSRLAPGPLSIPVLLGENPVCTMSNMAMRRAAFLRSGGLDETLVHNEDLEWLIRAVGGGARLRGLDAVLTHYRSSATGLSADLAAMKRGRQAALTTARRFGHSPSRRSEAIFLRYLARRALRLDQGRVLALGLMLQGLAQSPAGFLQDRRRGAMTVLGVLLSPLLPGPLRRRLFA